MSRRTPRSCFIVGGWSFNISEPTKKGNLIAEMPNRPAFNTIWSQPYNLLLVLPNKFARIA